LTTDIMFDPDSDSSLDSSYDPDRTTGKTACVRTHCHPFIFLKISASELDDEDSLSNSSAHSEESLNSSQSTHLNFESDLSQISNDSTAEGNMGDHGNSSAETDDTEPYEYPVPPRVMNNRANANESVIVINDTQQGPEEEVAPVENDDDDDDVILIPQNIETIDLCTQPFFGFNGPANLQNEVIEIGDSPMPERGLTRQNGVGPIRNNIRGIVIASTPYQLELQRHSQTRTPIQTASITPVRLNLNDSQDCSQTQGPKIRINCPICFESVIGRDPQSTSCGHVFCKACLTSALQTVKKCPMCRKAIGKNGYHKIHLS
jgi:hypothetical protein